MNAHEITRRLHGRWMGSYGTSACPVCQTECRRDQTALTITDSHDRLLLHCKRSNCAFQDILVALGICGDNLDLLDPIEASNLHKQQQRQDARKSQHAKALWDQSLPINETIAASYLRGLGIIARLPDTLRFNPSCWHGPASTRFPALIARVDLLNGSNAPAIHRTFLEPDGLKKADVTPAKMMLGKTQGCGVVLQSAHSSAPLVVCEGIESGLSLMSMFKEAATVVAALSTSGMVSFKLPENPGFLIMAGDNDTAGISAMVKLKERACLKGWDVMATLPTAGDWNDELLMNGVAA
jgi:phage/plasmid primase-like uncharacterized protein